MTVHSADLGAMLRTWRDRMPPAAAGLYAGRSRRTPGLRREELADLAGISVDYVVRLEQGRSTTPSPQVVESLSRALQLTAAEREHLYRLARLVSPTRAEISDHVPRGLMRILSRLPDPAVAVFAADWRLIWWNANWAALLGDPSVHPRPWRNFALDTFPIDDHGPRLSQWPVTTLDQGAVEQAVVSDLRRATGRFPDDRRLAELIGRLTNRNPGFARLWAGGAVGSHREEQKIVDHPSVGPIAVDCDVVIEGDAEQKIVMLSAAADTEDETKLRLALVSGATDSAVGQA